MSEQSVKPPAGPTSKRGTLESKHSTIEPEPMVVRKSWKHDIFNTDSPPDIPQTGERKSSLQAKRSGGVGSTVRIRSREASVAVQEGTKPGDDPGSSQVPASSTTAVGGRQSEIYSDERRVDSVKSMEKKKSYHTKHSIQQRKISKILIIKDSTSKKKDKKSGGPGQGQDEYKVELSKHYDADAARPKTRGKSKTKTTFVIPTDNVVNNVYQSRWNSAKNSVTDMDQLTDADGRPGQQLPGTKSAKSRKQMNIEEYRTVRQSRMKLAKSQAHLKSLSGKYPLVVTSPLEDEEDAEVYGEYDDPFRDRRMSMEIGGESDEDDESINDVQPVPSYTQEHEEHDPNPAAFNFVKNQILYFGFDPYDEEPDRDYISEEEDGEKSPRMPMTIEDVEEMEDDPPLPDSDPLHLSAENIPEVTNETIRDQLESGGGSGGKMDVGTEAEIYEDDEDDYDYTSGKSKQGFKSRPDITSGGENMSGKPSEDDDATSVPSDYSDSEKKSSDEESSLSEAESAISITEKIAVLQDSAKKPMSLREKYAGKKPGQGLTRCVDLSVGKLECLPPGELARKAIKTDEMWGIPEYTPLMKEQLIQLMRNIEQHPTNEHICLMYVLPENHPDFNPYLLQVVKTKDLNLKKYFTLSKYGVMAFRNGFSYYHSMLDFEREMHLFDRIKKIKFFVQFRLWKSFYIWRYNVRHLKIRAVKRNIEDYMFITKRPLRRMITELFQMCDKICSMGFLSLRPNYVYKLKDFIVVQENRLKEIYMRLRAFESMVIEMTLTACRSALIDEGFSPDEYPQEMDYYLKGLEIPLDSLIKPVGVLDYPGQWLTYSEQAKKRRVCARLTNFIHLIDYYVQKTYHCLMKNSLFTLMCEMDSRIRYIDREYFSMPKHMVKLGRLIQQNDQHGGKILLSNSPSPIFDVGCNWQEDKLSYSPSLEDFKAGMRYLFNLWQEAIFTYSNMLPNKVFDPYTQPIINGQMQEKTCGPGPSLQLLLDTDPDLNEILEVCDLILWHGFEVCDAYTEIFDEIRIFCLDNDAVNIDHFRQIEDVQEFSRLLEKFNKQLQIIEKVEDEHSMGVFRMNNSILRENARPTVQRCLEVLHEVIPRVGGQFVSKLLERMTAALDILEKNPTNADEYVDYLLFLDDIQEKMDDIERDLDHCSEIYDLIEMYSISADDEAFRGYNKLQPLLLALRNIIDRQGSNRDQLIAELLEHFKTDTEKIFKDMEAIMERAMAPDVLDPKTDAKMMTEVMTELRDRLLGHQEKATKFNLYQKQLKLDVTDFEPLEHLIKEVKLRHQLWDSMTSWNAQRADWDEAQFHTLDHEEMTKEVNKYLKNVATLEKGLPPNDVLPILKDKVEDMRNQLPLIANLQNPNLKRRHWDILEAAVKRNLTDESVTLQSLNESGIQNFAELIQEVSSQASSEFSLEALLKKVEDSWKNVEFVVLPHKDSRDVFILGGTDEIQVLLDDSNIHMTTIASSRHVGPIKHKVDEWVRLLDLFSRTLDEWLTCQRNWIYLESIFCAPDIQRQLPNEAKMFGQVDKSWREIMQRTNKMPAALRAATQPGLLEALQTNNELLDQIMKCLDDYLESKRVIFPRFYFLSNEELLEILAQTRNPTAVQPHLRKCFDAIQKLEFGGPASAIALDVLAMFSPEDERVQLTKGLKARGNVEEWLCKVEDAMFQSLKRIMRTTLTDYHAFPREEWLQKFPSQCVLAISQMMWAQEVHQILDGLGNRIEGMKTFEQKNFDNLTKLAAMVRGQLHPLVRAVLCALITIDVHARDIITSLVKNEVVSSDNFEWLKQLRYYWETEQEVAVTKMANAQYLYGYEYLGASPRLVITPLTDRCYLCLMGALQLDLGGAPAGPAGTGKTETTKDLAKSLAFMCVVFNCSDGIDYKMMGRFFSGLAQSGGWCCFDEFNRIEIEVLSVIAQQLITIRLAKVQRLARFMFEGREIKLVRTCAAFITMNPGYAGRTELPDNLKALFRPISMMVPDYGLIAEVILYSEGFESSKVLAQKMVNLYKLCSEQLSSQDHYDFGMRAVKSVLVMAGTLKRANPDINENVVLIRALRDSNLPKFLAHDAILLQGIIQDLFPGVVIPDTDYGVLQEEGVRVTLEKGYQTPECFIRKMIQLFDTMVVRHGVMLVGPTGGGKTTIYQMLKAALTALGGNKQLDNPYFRNVETYVLNPKAVTMGELYGEINPLTLEWRDGLLGIMVRTAVKPKMTFHQWVICDGPVDAVWIENMNTVLDDNKMLCLANSERIKLTQWVRMMFEVADLCQASPATVSRCGMVYVDPKEMGWIPFVQSWLQKLSVGDRDDLKPHLTYLFNKYVEEAFTFVAKNCSEVIPQAVIGKISMMCSILEALISKRGIDMTLEKPKFLQLVTQIFVFSLVWSIGGNINEKDYQKFDAFVRKKFEGEEYGKLPKTGLLYSFYNNLETKKMDMWETIMPPYIYNPHTSFVDVLVPTVDTVRFGFLMELLLEVNRAVLYTGPTGTGKSAIAKFTLTSVAPKYDYLPVYINFSAQTTSKRTQEMIEGKLEKRKKGLLSAPYGKKVIVLIDDINMPKLDKYGAQPSLELLRQLMDFNGCYDRLKCFWKELQNVVMSAACAPPGGGRNAITPRLMRHFCLLAIPSPTQNVLVQIYRAIMRGFLEEFTPEVKDMADKIVNAAISVYQFMVLTFLPTPSKAHYVFNMRDLSKCVQGVLQANKLVVMSKLQMTNLYYHECLRVFHDRLTDDPDRALFKNILQELCAKVLGTPLDKKKVEGIVYGDFMKPGIDRDARVYDEIVNKDKLKQVLSDYLDEYNIMTGREMHMVFFGDAAEHITRVARILRTDRGNALLVGVGGTGKQSLTKLAAYISGYKCFQIELMRGYDYESFHEDLKKLYESAGMKNEKMTFLFTDTQIAYEEFLEDINNILNSGEVPNLLEPEDQERMISGIRADAKLEGIADDDRDGLYDFFIRRIRSNLHIVLCMSPVGDSFRIRCRMFPSLVNCCTIDWFSEWPTEALLSVAMSFMTKLELGNIPPRSMADMSVLVHESVTNMSEVFYEEMRRRYYTTPSSYLELIKLFTGMLNERREKILSGKARIQNGLTKLLETNVLVKEMRIVLKDLEPTLRQKSEAVENLMVKLNEDQMNADIVRRNVQVEENAAKVKAQETQIIAEDAQKDLAEALPALEAAVKALDALSKSDISELKAYQKPPALVQTVMEAVCILFDRSTTWKDAQLLMAGNFITQLQDYPKDNVTDKLIQKLKPYMDNKSFTQEAAKKISTALGSIIIWVRAIDMYAKVNKTVAPKRARYMSAQRELDEVMATLQAKQNQLNEVEKKIHALQQFFENTMSEKQQLEDNMELTAARLRRAGRLTSALASEQTRWQESVLKFDDELKNIIGDVFVGAACVAYFGAFTANYRHKLVQGWVQRCIELKIPVSAHFTLASFADPFEVRVWNGSGLPKDNTSTENAVLVTRGRRWPLMIDPQDQANRWIKQMEAERGLKVLKLSDGTFMRTMENCVRLGTPCLLEEVGETLDPSLEPILLRQIFVQGGRQMIRLGDSNVDYDHNFRLYMTTKLANPHYLPEICIKVTIINFTVTMSGLEDQLLSDVVAIERPDMEAQRSQLIASINSDKNQLISLENKILRLLFQSEGNILDDEELVQALNESKETSVAINKRLKEAEDTEVKLSAARERYRPVASRGSVLYFVVAQLAALDPMYQYSLKYFVQVFIQCIASTEKSEELEERLRILRKATTLATYTNISRGLFERHKLVFSFMLCTDIMRNRNSITDLEWNFFLRGGIGVESGRTMKPAMADWITVNQWNQLCDLETAFPIWEDITIASLKEVLHLTIGNFRMVLFPNVDVGLSSKTAKKAVDWDKKLSKFQKLLLIKCCAEEKLVAAITEFVRSELGHKFIESPSIDLHKVYKDLNKLTPLVFVLSVGSDPTAAFYRFAGELDFLDRVSSISLGQGQGPIAEAMIRAASASGNWVLLQNCHLAASWMPTMEVCIKSLADRHEEVADSFRLFLSSMPTSAFPVSILQDSVKVTNEPPKGIRANVRQAMLEMDKNYFEDNVLGMDWRRMVFSICMFHAVTLERKKFGPLGWNIKYEFNDSDRQCCLLNLEMFCKDVQDVKGIPWDALEYITGQITYGGRVTDSWDIRTLVTILRGFFSPPCLAKNHKFSPSGIYYAPFYKHAKEYISYVDKLPIMDEPEIFGMHENANIRFQQQESQTLLEAILSVQPRVSGGKAASAKDELAYEQANVFESKLPAKIDPDRASGALYKPDSKGRTPSLSVFLRQEVDRFNRLLAVIRSSLEQLKKGIKGLVVMSDDLEKMYQSFLNNQVPENWTRAAYGSLKSLASWYNDMLLRANFLTKWYYGTVPSSFWISGFFFQQGFLTSVLQTFARKHNLPIDQLKFLYIVAPVVKEESEKPDHIVEKSLVPPTDGVLVHGLFLEAARWDFKSMRLADPEPGVMNPAMPVIHFLPAQNPSPPSNIYTCPLYKTSVRAGTLSTTGHSTNFIVSIQLPSRHVEDYWILKGTCLLTQLTD